MTTRRVEFDLALGSTGRISTFTYEVTRDDSSDLGPEYRCELISGDISWHDLDDAEEAAIRTFEEDLLELAAAEAAGKGRAA